MLNRKTVMALAAAMVMAVLYGCSGSDNSGLKNDLEMYKGQVADLTTQRDARITPEAARALRVALGEMELTPQILEMLVARADITADAYEALMDALPGMELTEPTLRDLAGRAAITAAEYQALMDAMGTMDLTPANIAMLLGRANITVSLYDALMREMPQGMDLSVLNLRMLAERAEITDDQYQRLVDALAGMTLDVPTLTSLVGRADITKGQYDALMRVMSDLNPTSLQNVVNKARYYDLLLVALGATGMTVEEARARARALVAAETTTGDVDLSAKARQVAALIMTESTDLPGAEDTIPQEDIDLLKARFGPNVLDEGVDAADRRTLDLAMSGLKIKDLATPALVYEPTGGEKATPTTMADSLAAPFNGMVFTETLRGGRRLVTYAYTDVENPKSESFARAYGRLVTAGAYVVGDSEGAAGIQGPPMPPTPPVDDPGATATPAETMGYDDYIEASNAYEALLLTYKRNLTEVSPADLVGHPLKGLPLNTVGAANIIADTAGADEMPTLAADYFWNTLGSFTNDKQPPQLVDPVSDDQMHVPGGSLSEATAYYRPIVGEFAGAGTPSQLSASFDGVPGHFICSAADAALQGDFVGLCSITVRPSKDGAVYSATGTWKFVATKSSDTVATSRQDADYLLLGWWVEEPVSATGDIRFGRFFSGSDPFTAVDIAGLTGTANYVGPAVGKWATREEGSLTAEKGVFKATADLDANFGDDNIISGQVRDFDIPGFNAVVVLAPNTAGAANIEEATFTGVTRGEADGRDWAGTWRGAFYGNDRYRERVAMPDSPQGYPGYASGLFNAYFGCPEEDCPVDADAANPRAGELGFVGVSGVFGAEYTETEE